MSDIGFILVGHGTRQLTGQRQLGQVFADFARNIAPLPAELGFLELAEPTIEEAVSRLANRGVRRLISVPVLLFTAGHAERDIPDAVAAAASKYDLQAFDQTPSLQCCQAIVELSAVRFREAVCSSPKNIETGRGLCDSGCSGRWCSQVGLLMIGRGSSSASATESMLEFTAARQRLTRTAWHQTAFIHAQSPSVDEGLNQLAESGCAIAVVQPHLLFEGELIESLRRLVAERAVRHPEQRWLITETLGTDQRLGKTLADLAMDRAPKVA